MRVCQLCTSRRSSLSLQNRDALNPAAFYKKSAQRLPEYFQVGTVIQGATEFYSSRLSKQQRGRTFAEELLHDGDVKFTLKKRFTKLQARVVATSWCLELTRDSG